ncbi:DNA-formamidopyrimidine glycosylase family protein [Ilumatobacter sp.]|uniref:DNA-formamidopyrimidine glycosylase family protein n=1 Tax=Ilumatobacter sp. TaxID=1967498 RepID=UPI003C34BB65
MPEGDTLRRAAEVLTPILEGQVVTDLWFRKLRGYRPRVGDRIHRVDAVGKYLLIEFDRRLVLHTHLGMSGTWRAGPVDRPAPRDPRLRIVIETALGRALCFAAPDISTHLRDSGNAPADRLGPDLSDDDTDLDAVLERSRSIEQDTSLAELLLNQHVAAGVGNVFKSETLFVAGLHPFTSVGATSDEQLTRMWSVAHRQLVANRGRPYRSTTGAGNPGRTYVYGRHRFACRRCDNAISFSAAGERTERSTYWCPTCQPAQG